MSHVNSPKRSLYIVPPALLVLALAGLPLLCGRKACSRRNSASSSRKRRSRRFTAIQQGQITCVGLVQAYLARASAYNDTSDRLVTRDGAPIPAAPGTMRAGAPLTFPTETVAISTLLPNYNEYAGPPIELGRMEPTSSDPAVQQQYGMTIGTPNSGKVNALGTINLRGERSVTCKGDRDKASVRGRASCRARPPCAKSSGSSPTRSSAPPNWIGSTAAIPTWQRCRCTAFPFSFKDPFDTKDMRTTAAADARYDIDFPARDHTLVAQLRQKGAIIYAKAVNTEYNGIPGDPGGKNEPNQILLSDQGYQRSSWGGNRQPLRRHARRLARLQLRLRRVGQHEPGHLQHLRRDQHVVPRTGQPQLGRADPAAQGDGLFPRRRHRRRHPQRPRRHSLPQRHRFREGARRAEGSGQRLLRSARRLHDRVARQRQQHACTPPAPRRPAAAGSLKGVRIGVIRESMLTFPA